MRSPLYSVQPINALKPIQQNVALSKANNSEAPLELPLQTEIVFEVTKEHDGGYDAESSTENLSAQGDTWEELCGNIRKTVEAYFHDGPKPQAVRLHHVREELLDLI